MRLVPSCVPFLGIPILAVAMSAPAMAASIAGARVDATPSGGAQVTIQFTGGNPPASRVLGQNTTEVSLNFDNVTLGPQAPPTIAGAGPIGSISLVANGTATSVALHLTSAATVRVRASGPSVVIEVPPGAASAPPNPFGAQAPAAPSAVTPAANAQSVVVMLKYADISEIAGVLVSNSSVTTNDTFSPQQSSVGASTLGSSFGGAGGFTPPQQQNFNAGNTFGNGQAGGLAQRLSDNVAVDRRLNAIILTGSPDVIDPLRAMIEKLDVPVPSVILETEVVELNDTASKELGFDFSPGGGGIIVNGSGGSGTTGNGYTIKTLSTGTGQITLGGNLYAQISAGNGRVLAKPRILAQSGQQASIITGDAIPIVTAFAVQNVGTSQQVNYVNVGVNLQIQPRVSSDGFVTSHIYCDVSSVTGFTNNAPQISQRTANTLATVRDGDSFVIGGLLQDNETRSLSKLPFIGDIPIIGAFFRHLSTTKSQTNLYIVVTPHIVGIGQNAPPAPTGFPLSLPKPLPQSSAPPAPASPSPASTSPQP